MNPQPCPKCSTVVNFSKRRNRHYCDDCELEFDDLNAEPTAHRAQAVGPIDLGRADTPLKLFLSYGRDEHVAEVRALRDALRARGHEVWFDEEKLDPGKTWDQRIDEGLQWCEKVVLTMTPHSVRQPNGFCLNELAKALDRQRDIVPVLLAEVPGGAPITICRVAIVASFSRSDDSISTKAQNANG